KNLRGWEWHYQERLCRQELRTLKVPTDDVVVWVRCDPDKVRLASAGADGNLTLWDASTGQRLRTFTGHTARVGGAALSPDGTGRTSARFDKTVKWGDTATGQVLHPLKGHSLPALCVAFSPDGGRLASGGPEQPVKVSDTASGRELRSLKNPPQA